MFEAKQVLIITREVKFATNAVAALENHGYKVTTFTNSRPALEFLRQNPQHCAVLDFRVNDMPAPDTLDHMRAMQPEIAVIAAPNHPAVHDLKDKHNIQAIINIPYPLRRFVDVLETALQQAEASKPDNKSSKSKSKESGKDLAAIEFWVSSDDEGETIVQYVPERENPQKPTDELATRVFDKLAAEEPPMPSFEEGSTVRDLSDHLKDPKNIRRYLEVFSDDSTARNRKVVEEEVEPNEDSRSIPAAMILETAMDESTPIRTFSLNEFMSRAQESGKQILVPPSWLQEDQKYIREPEFLPEELPSITNTFEYTITKTTPNEAQQQQIESDPTNLVTDQIEPIQRSHPPKILPEVPEDTGKATLPKPPPLPEMPEDTKKGLPVQQFPSPPPLPEMPKPLDAEVLDEDEVAAHIADFEKMQSDPNLPVVPEKPALTEGITEKAVPFADFDKSNPYVAQLALTLTQVSLELSVEASVLVDNGEIIAYSGNLPREEIESLRGQLEADWSAEPNKSRIQFITLPGSGADYMLFTCQTAANHTLSMIFGGATPFDAIRRQGKRLSEALAAVPEPVAEAEVTVSPEEAAEDALHIPSDEEVGERSRRTFVWMLNNPNGVIQLEVKENIVVGLDKQLMQAGWHVEELMVQDEFIYLVGDVPVKVDSKTAIDQIMQLSAEIFNDWWDEIDPATIWHDSYLVLQPGRTLDTEEIQQFINFARE